MECPIDGSIYHDFSSKGGVKRHDDLLVALYLLEQQNSLEDGAALDFQNLAVPEFHNDNSIEIEEPNFGGIFGNTPLDKT